MKFDWENWNLGGKLIFGASCLAIGSMPLNWIELGFLSASGFSQDAWLLLALWIYPALVLGKNGAMNPLGGYACSIGSGILTLLYISDKSVEFMGQTQSAAATGSYLFLAASIALVLGVHKYAPATVAKDPVEP